MSSGKQDEILEVNENDENIENYENESLNEEEGDAEEEEEEENAVFTIQKDEIENVFNNNRNIENNNKNSPRSNSNEINTANSIRGDDDDDEVNVVRISVTIVAAFPSGLQQKNVHFDDEQEDDYKYNKYKRKTDNNEEEEYEKGDGKRLSEGPKPQNYYKFEYQLMPDETEPTITEVVSYKIAAKLFPDKDEPRVIKTWETDSQIWVAWNHTHEIKMTKSRLLKLFDHEFVLKIWDTKDYCSPRTKFDKPKPFKFPPPKPGENPDDLNEVRSFVLKQCNNYLRFIPKELHNKLDRELPTQQKRSVEPQEIITKPNVIITNTLIAVSNKTVASQKVGNKLSELAVDNELLKTKKSKDESRSASKTSAAKSESQLNKPKKVKDKKDKKEIANEVEQIKKNGACSIKIKMKILYTDYKFVTVRLDKSLQTLEDCFVTINLENNLMSERQLESLNPMMIKIDKIVDLPERPLNYQELREKCEPVYCTYKFLKQEMHKTNGKVHSKVIHLNDINVFLAGLCDPDELREYLFGAPFEIEVHDRDRKPNQQSQTPCIFGNDANDDNISSVNAIAAQKTVYNPFEIRNKFWDPYGVAKLSLYEFLEGKRLVEFFLPISPCPAPEVNGGRLSVKSAVTNKTSTPLSMNTQTTAIATTARTNTTKFVQHDPLSTQTGDYLDSNAHVYITISLAKSLTSTEQLVVQSRATTLRTFSSSTCVFGRIICVFDYNKTTLVPLIFNMVRKINSSSLNLAEYSSNIQDAALSTYKLNEKEQKSKTLDIITGFHLLDGKFHIIILEGLKDFGLREIYENIPRKKEDGVKVLYNSAMNFSTRLYASLDVDLLRIKLFEPLENIVKKPLLYIRDMAPKSSVDGLLKLHQLTSIERLRDATRCDAFPTAEMVVSMSREFGSPLTNEDLEKFKAADYNREATESKSVQNNMYSSNSNIMIPHTSKVWTPIDNYNETFLQNKQDNTTLKDFVKQNMETIRDKSERNRFKKESSPQEYVVIEKPAYNYSSQKLNQTQTAIQELREKIRNSGRLYSYNPEFHHSMTFAPIDLDEYKKEEARRNKERWVAPKDWVPRGPKSASDTNVHPKKPDQATLDCLRIPLNENYVQKSDPKSQKERYAYKWDNRTKDFNNWTKPNPNKYENLPVTIFDAGTKKEFEEKNIAMKEKEAWLENVVVEDPLVRVHRVLPATETLESGRRCNNQLDKLKGILKDQPRKKGLVTKGVDFNSIPALAVTVDLRDHSKENTKYGLKPGDSMSLRITDHKNVIPLKSNERTKYIRLKNQDFQLVHTEHRKVHKRPTNPLSIDEKARFNEYYHSPYCDMTKYVMPDDDDINYVANLHHEHKGIKNTIMST